MVDFVPTKEDLERGEKAHKKYWPLLAIALFKSTRTTSNAKD